MQDATSKVTNEPRQRGGARPGAGPKTKSGTGEKLGKPIALRLTRSQEAKIGRIAADRGKADIQDAIRDLIDEAAS